MRLGIDPKQADQLVRGSIVLPNGIGKSRKAAHGTHPVHRRTKIRCGIDQRPVEIE